MLEQIQSPRDIKKLNLKDLNTLSKEIRKKIVETVSVTGGHLAPSLGVVELTLAIHYVFDAPLDRIIWDVGHQAYAHKLITGRYVKFHTLRQYGGISGFPKRSESPYDCLDTGHSSTSISAGLGMSTGISLQKKNSKVVVVIGDGSMTAGLAFEGLNNAGHLKKDLIVILNDNEMSISPNVGALSSFLSRKLTGRLVRRFKQELESFLKRSEVGENIWAVLKRSEESLKGLFTPGMLFEALQFDYIGPIPGHNLEVLIETLKNIKDLDGPILLHVITKKGKGYPPAERHPERFHGTGPFDPITGEPKKPEKKLPPTYTEVFSNALVELAKEDKRICAITAAMPSGTGLKKFQEEIPERFFDVGIAEQHAVTFAAGLALEGLKPVCAIYSTFLQRAYDQIIHDVCLTSLPVVFAIDRGGLVGDDGPTHHGAFDLSFLRAIPNLVIMAPKDENELRDMLYTSFKLDCPVAVRYPRGRGLGVGLEKDFKTLECGKAEVIEEGDDVTIIAVGHHVQTALTARKILLKDGFRPTIINARFVKPIDNDLILHYAKITGHVVTIEENALIGGFGSAISELLMDKDVSEVKMRCLGLPDRFIEHGDQSILREMLGLDARSLASAVRELLRK